MKIELLEKELRTTITVLSRWRTYLIVQGQDDRTVKAMLDKVGSKPHEAVRVN